MKKIFFIIFFFFLVSLSAKSESWDAFTNVDRMWDGQHSVTNQEFEQVINKLEEKAVQKEEKIKKKKRKKLFGSGTTLHEELNPDKDAVSEFEQLKSKEDLLINLPVQIIIDGKTLDKGYYKVVGEKDSETKKLYLNLYQSQFFKAKFEVVETHDDFSKEEINFVEALPYNDNFIKIIYGSIDFNAYAYIPFVEQ